MRNVNKLSSRRGITGDWSCPLLCRDIIVLLQNLRIKILPPLCAKIKSPKHITIDLNNILALPISFLMKGSKAPPMSLRNLIAP